MYLSKVEFGKKKIEGKKVGKLISKAIFNEWNDSDNYLSTYELMQGNG